MKRLFKLSIALAVILIIFVIIVNIVATQREKNYYNDISNYKIIEYRISNGDTLWYISEDIISKQNLKLTTREYINLLYEANVNLKDNYYIYPSQNINVLVLENK